MLAKTRCRSVGAQSLQVIEGAMKQDIHQLIKSKAKVDSKAYLYSGAEEKVREVRLNLKGEDGEQYKMIEELNRIVQLTSQDEQINLRLETDFQNDFDFKCFAKAISPFISIIRNLVWVVKGKWKDDRSGSLFYYLFRDCPNLYSLNIEICSQFGDNSAEYISYSLEQLENLRILKMHIFVGENKNKKKIKGLSIYGNRKINNAIQQLKNLLIVEYNGIDESTDRMYLKQLENRTFEIWDDHYYFKVNDDFKRIMSERGSKLTSLHIKNNDALFRFQDSETCMFCLFPISYRVFLEYYYGLLDQVLCLPYLTQFKNIFAYLMERS